MQIPLARAEAFAANVVEALRPHCLKIEIAGSIRRRKPLVHDIDLVVLPSDWNALRRRALERAYEKCCGEQVFRLEHRTGIQIDIYRAHNGDDELFETRPANWGTLLLCRTGSAEHNIKLCDRAAELGLHWHPHQGVKDAQQQIIASVTEEDVFQALDLPFVPPEERG